MASFTPKSWLDLPQETTPIDAAALIDLENRLAAWATSQASTVIPSGVVSDSSIVSGSVVDAATGGRSQGLRDFVSILDFGAHFDTLISSKAFVNDGTHSLSTSNVYLSDYSFISSDIGKSIVVTDGGTTGNISITTIANISSGKAVLASPVSWASGGFSNGTVAWGHDDSTGYSNALTYLVNNYKNGGGNLLLPAGNSLVLSQTVINATNTWSLGIFGQGLGVTTILVANTNGWLSIANGSRAAQCSIRDLDVLACEQGVASGFEFYITNPGGNQQQTFWADHILFNSFVPTVGYFSQCAMNLLGTFRPELRDVFVNARFGPNVSQAMNDDSPGFATEVGIVLDACYTPHLINCDVWDCTRGWQMIVGSGTQGLYTSHCQAVGCREGFWIESPDVEPQATIVGGHQNNRDVNTGIYQRKLTNISNVLFYNPYLAPGSSSTPGPTTLGANVSATPAIPAGTDTVQIGSTTDWNTAGGMLTIDSECMTYTGITSNTLTGVTRAAYGTSAAAHTSGDEVYGNSMSTLTSALNTGAITQGTTISVVNTAGMPRIGAVLIGSEWWTYDNLHQSIYSNGSVTGGTFTVTFTWNGNTYTTATIAWNAGWPDISAAMQTAASAVPAGQIVSSNGSLPASPIYVTAMFGITRVGPLVITSINSGSLTGGGTYQVTGTSYQTKLYNLSRAAFGTTDPGSNYSISTMVTAGVADVLVAGHSYGVNMEDNQIHSAGHQLRKALQIQDSSHDNAQSSNWFHPVAGYGAAIDGTSSGNYITENKYSSFNVTPPVTPILDGASDTSFRSARRRHMLAQLSSTQSFTSGSTITVTNWTAVEDTDGFLTSGSTVTIPHNRGIKRVRVTCSVAWQTSTGGGDRRLRIGQNGTFTTPGHSDQYVTGAMTDENVVQEATSGIFTVSDGDTINIQAEQTSGGTISINVSGSTFLEVEVIE